MKKLVASVALDVLASIGEGPLWDAEGRCLWWIDIAKQSVHRFDPLAGNDQVYPVTEEIHAVALRTGPGLLVVCARTFAVFEPESGRLTTLLDVGSQLAPGTTFNDADVDSAGRLWTGSMMSFDEDDELYRDRARTRDHFIRGFGSNLQKGSIFSLSPELKLTPHVDEIVLSNGICWSPDNATMYHIDTFADSISAFDFDPDAGTISNRRSFVDTSGDSYFADGMTVDEEGGVWVAMHDGGEIRRYQPDGSLDVIVECPVRRVTSCAFGGEDLGDLFITSMSHGLTAAEAQPKAGAIFHVRPGVRGLPVVRFAS